MCCSALPIDTAQAAHYATRMTSPAQSFQRLVDIVARLRAPDGCPWDREQTPQSAAPYLLEEAFEAAEAIDHNDRQVLCEELGDVLLQVVFQTQMIADTTKEFTMDDVANGVSDKLVRRHPHVFGDVTVSGSAEVLANWETIKKTEKPERESMLDGIPTGLPALLRAFRLGQKASRVNFDWPDAAGVIDTVTEEVGELQRATPAERDHEFGDLLFALVQWARHHELDPEGSLRRASERFTGRFRAMERRLKARGQDPTQLSSDEWDQLWQEAKRS